MSTRARYKIILAIPILLLLARASGRAIEAMPKPGRQDLPPLIRRGPSTSKVVALTFDDGPDPRFTPRIVEMLKAHHIRATFFVVGKNAEKYPYLIKLIDESGEILGNHTYSHPDLRVDSAQQVREEIWKCDQVLIGITGKKPKLFRPPKGFYDLKALQILKSMDLQPVLWALTVEHKTCPTPKDLANRILENVQPGEIILAHDGRLDREKTVEAIPLIIDGLKAKGYRFVTVPEMLDLLQKKPAVTVQKTARVNEEQAVLSLLKRLWL